MVDDVLRNVQNQRWFEMKESNLKSCFYEKGIKRFTRAKKHMC